MPRDVERFIRIQRPQGDGWKTIPLGERVRVWETAHADHPDGSKLTFFHIGFMPGPARGQRVAYLGQLFLIQEVSDSKRLVGLELTCMPIAGEQG